MILETRHPFKLHRKYPLISHFPADAKNKFSSTRKKNTAGNRPISSTSDIYICRRNVRNKRIPGVSSVNMPEITATSPRFDVFVQLRAYCTPASGEQILRACVCVYVHARARSCAVTSLAAPGRLIRPPLPWRRPIWQEAK